MGFWGDNRWKIMGAAAGGPVGLGVGWAADSHAGPFKDVNFPNISQAPSRPSYVPGWNPGMSMAPEIGQALSGIQPNQLALNQLRSEATRQGPSKWAGLAQQQQMQALGQARQQAASDASSGAAAARAALAQKGGLSGGASERIAKDAMRNRLMVGQQAANQYARGTNAINMEDEQNRMKLLSAQPGQELANSQFDLSKLGMYGNARQFDVGQAVGESGRQNDFNSQLYGDAMRGWAAQNAYNQDMYKSQNTGGLFNKGGFLGLGF